MKLVKIISEIKQQDPKQICRKLWVDMVMKTIGNPKLLKELLKILYNYTGLDSLPYGDNIVDYMLDEKELTNLYTDLINLK